MRAIRWLAAALALLASAAGASAQQSFRTRLVRVTSVNQITVRLDQWPLQVRLHGVAASDGGRERQERARQYLERRARDVDLRIVVRGTASQNVVYGDVFRDGEPEALNVELIRQGWARWSRKYAPARRDLENAEAEALRRGGAGQVAATSVAPRAPTRAIPWRAWLGALGGAVSIGFLIAASRLCHPAARIRSAPLCPVSEATGGWVKLRGVARARDGVVVRATGGAPALFVHERTWRFAPAGQPGSREYRWKPIGEVCEAVPFTLEDPSGTIQVRAAATDFYPVRTVLFFNGVPGPHWHEPAYPDDTRTQLDLLPVNAPVTVVGRGVVLQGKPALEHALVIEGDETLIGRDRARNAVGFILVAVVLATISAFVGGMG